MTSHYQYDTYMQKAFNLALKGSGYTHSNPIVGCILLNKGRILNTGYHRKYGDKHAERECLEDISPPADSELIINLEPCCHYGKTSPCTDIIIQKRIKRVILSNTDPNPLVNHKGIKALKDNGIHVITGILEDKGYYINRHYFHFIKHRSPYITLKLASTLDGKIADRNFSSKWITNEKSRIKAHWLRGINRAIIVGINTFIKDKPRLNTRYPYREMPSPIRVFIDRTFKLKDYIKLLNDARETIIYTYDKSNISTPSNIDLIRVDKKEDIIYSAVKDLGERSIESILLEGGGEMAFQFLKRKLVREIHIIYAPKIIGGNQSISAISGEGFLLKDAINIKKYKIHKFDEDLEFEGFLD